MKSIEIQKLASSIKIGDLVEFKATEGSLHYVALVTEHKDDNRFGGIIVLSNAPRGNYLAVNTVHDNFLVKYFVRYNGIIQLQND